LKVLFDDHDERSDLISNPRGPAWSGRGFQQQLIEKLDRNYVPFTRTVRGLCDLLEGLSRKLGLETADYTTASYHNISTQAKEELMH
jgi:hypothetical protein